LLSNHCIGMVSTR